MTKPIGLFFAAVLFAAVPLVAQTTHYCPSNTPNAGTCNGSPMGFTDVRFNHLIPTADLPATPVRIVDMAFAPCATVSKTIQQLQIRMTQTTSTSLDTTFASNVGPAATVCFDGPLTWQAVSSQWSFIGLQSPFGFDPARGNLVFELRYRGSPSSSPSCHRHNAYPRVYCPEPPRCPDPYNSTTATVSDKIAGLKVAFAIDSTNLLQCDPQVSVGGTANLKIVQGGPALFYQVATSLGQRPGLNVGSCTVWLAVDNLFLASAGGTLPGIFQNYSGQLTASGQGTAALAVPSLPALSGLVLCHAALTYSGQGIAGCTNTCCTQIQ